MPSIVMISKLKKYKINFNAVCFNYKTGMYEDNEEAYQTYSAASKNKWRCEKCFEKFQSYTMLYEHKIQIHSY
jgi:hypothetical protein